MLSTDIKCGRPDDLEYGKVIVDKHFTISQYECDYGYKLIGHSSRKCYYGEWEGKAPICKRKYYTLTTLILNVLRKTNIQSAKKFPLFSP